MRELRSSILTLVLALTMLTAAACGGGDDGGAVVPPETGFLFIGGEYLEPPYEVVVEGFEIRINGEVVVALFDEDAPEPDDEPAPENPRSASEAVDTAGERFLELGGPTPNAPDPAVLAELTSFLLALDAVSDVEQSGAELIVTDRQGERASLFLMSPALVGEAELLEDLEARARAWRSALGRGAAVFFAGGASLIMPGRAVPDVLPEVLEALEGDEDERVARLLGLINSRQIVESLAEAGAPDDGVAERIPEPEVEASALLPSPSRAFVSGAPPFGEPATAPAVHGEHGDYETPRADAAYLFSPFTAESVPGLRRGVGCHGGAIAEAAERHNYYVYSYDGTSSSVDALLESSGNAGIMWFCMHGGNAFEFFHTKSGRDERLAELRAKGVTGLGPGSHPGVLNSLFGKRWYVVVGQSAITKHWTGAGTIVHSEGCSGQNHSTTYIAQGAREYIGTFDACVPNANGELNRQFWGRLDGTIEDGEERSVGTAFKQVFAGTIFRLAGPGGGKTVLSPAVRDFEPKEDIVVPGIFEGRVHFDAKMDKLISLPRIIELDGCDASVIDTEWLDDYTLRFRYRANTPETLTYSVQSFWANPLQELGLRLDGNESPDGTDHVGPSGDNWEWSVRCVTLAESPTPTETSTPPPTESPSPEPTETATPEPTETATPEPTETATPEPTETATPEPTETATATPAPTEPPGVKAFIDGFEVTYIGALVMESGSTVQLTFCVVDSEGQPASGEFFATLGDPPGDPHASHGSGIIGADGKVTITIEVTWPAGGETQLWFFYPDTVHPIAKILITQ